MVRPISVLPFGGWILLFVCCALTISVRTSCGDEPTALPASKPERLIVVRLTEEIFKPFMGREIDVTKPVGDWILGTYVTGQARTQGQPRVKLLNDPNFAAFQVTIRGTTSSRTVGQSGPAIIRSRAETAFTATKRVVFAPGIGFFAEPAKVDSKTRTYTEGIESTRRGLGGRIVQRRARADVEARRPQLNQIAKRNADRRICAALDTFLSKYLARLNEGVKWRDRFAAIRGKDAKPFFACCSRDGYLEIMASSEDRQGKFIDLPELPGKSAPVQFWVHQSLVGEDLARKLATLTDNQPVIFAIFSEIFSDNATSEAPAVDRERQATSPVHFSTVQDWLVIQFDPHAKTKAGDAKN